MSSVAAMDVDPPTIMPAPEGTKIAIHPLAIVHMSDQYTRVTSGGSPLPKTAPVVGLLFGTNNDSRLQITDADDIPINTANPERHQQQVSLHQAVFPQHTVVGWYRVGGQGDEPTQDDLQTTLHLSQQYKNEHMVFLLLQVTQTTGDDDELPIGMYVLPSTAGGVLVAAEDWHLQTSEPERISIERVVREQPQDTNDKRSSSSSFVTQTGSVQESLQSLQARIQLLLEFLQATQAGQLPWNASLVRRVQALVYAIPALSAAAPMDDDEGLSYDWMSQLATVAKTVKTVQEYTEKFAVVYTSKGPSSSTASLEARRF